MTVTTVITMTYKIRLHQNMDIETQQPVLAGWYMKVKAVGDEVKWPDGRKFF